MNDPATRVVDKSSPSSLSDAENVPDSYQSISGSPSTELGYIFLEEDHCGPNSTIILPETMIPNEWIDVKIRNVAKDSNELSSEDSCGCAGSPAMLLQWEKEDPNDVGHLVWHCQNNGELLSWQGNVREVSCADCGMQRPDSVILLGLIGSQHCKMVNLTSWKVLKTQNSIHMVITLSFPMLLDCRSLNHLGRLKKPLPNGLQTLLMMIESDWNKFDEKMKLLSSNSNDDKMRNTRVSLFPNQLTIGELYRRLEGATERSIVTEASNHRSYNRLLDLPSGIWSRSLGPFLNADDVECLRNSCKSLHHVLRDLIPGLRLQLYPHQVRSLEWMRQREHRALSENEILNQSSNLHRSITGGVSVFLQSRDGSFSIRLNVSTGEECTVPDEESVVTRKVARGGMLCDDPGLGKTITVLALILQTCFSESKKRESAVDSSKDRKDEDVVCDVEISSTAVPNETRDDVIFYTYWSQEVTAEFRVRDYLKLVNEFLRKFPVIPVVFRQVRSEISNDVYGKDFRCFDQAIRSMITASAFDSPALTEHSMGIWDQLVNDFKRSQMRSVRRYFCSVASKPNSKVASLIDKEKKNKLRQSLLPSSSTLLVVPAVLLDHWKGQIDEHVNWKYCTDRIPMIFVFTSKTSDSQLSLLTSRLNNNLVYAPILFIDKSGSMPLPSAKILAKFRLVITTTNRFKNEWKNGSFQREIQEQDSAGVFQYVNLENSLYSRTSCELLKVHWNRMIVDEGHSMGNKTSSTIQFSSWIQATKRWVMTGTPTKHGGTELVQLLSLLRFLGHEFFTAKLDGELYWKRQIAREWREGNFAAFYRISSLLRCLMKRHTKLDIDALKPPAYHTTKISMSSSEAATYNTLVSGVQNNILLTSMDSKTSGLQDSLLSRNQAKNARQALSNLRRVCTGCTRVVPVLPDALYRQTMDMAESLGLSEEQRINVKKYIHCVENEGQPECGFCAFRVPSQILMPCCAGTVCTECMTNKTKFCLLCDEVFDPDVLQRFQPGFELHWKLNLVTEQKPKLEVAHFATPDREITNVDPPLLQNEVLIRPTEMQTRTRIPGDGHACVYDKYRADGFCKLCFQAHDSCNLMNKDSRCVVCYKLAEPCPQEESKSFFLTEKLLLLHKQYARRSAGRITTRPTYQDDADSFRPLKVIVFSQFRQTLNYVGDRLLRRFGPGCIGEYFGKHRSQELQKFRFDASCFCLLLTKDGAEGLDLSFVTNIIFLDEIYDKSLRDQAVARAWRMGAKGSVEVETLVARNSVEETIGEIESSKKGATKSREKERVKKLLLSLKLNTDYHYFAKSDGDKTAEIKRKQAIPYPAGLSANQIPRRKKVKFAFES